MTECQEKRKHLAEEFKDCRKAFIAIGDETRQMIIIALLESEYNGIRVGEITAATHLSRPAVSHHLQVLKDAGIINMRREGTKNYYYMDANKSQWSRIASLINHINTVVQSITEQQNES